MSTTLAQLSTTLTDDEDDVEDSGENRRRLNRRLDYISVAIVCGIILLCFVICFIVGCRRSKRRRPPRCQDVVSTVTPSAEPSRSGMPENRRTPQDAIVKTAGHPNE